MSIPYEQDPPAGSCVKRVRRHIRPFLTQTLVVVLSLSLIGLPWPGYLGAYWMNEARATTDNSYDTQPPGSVGVSANDTGPVYWRAVDHQLGLLQKASQDNAGLYKT